VRRVGESTHPSAGEQSDADLLDELRRVEPPPLLAADVDLVAEPGEQLPRDVLVAAVGGVERVEEVDLERLGVDDLGGRGGVGRERLDILALALVLLLAGHRSLAMGEVGG